MNNDKRLIEDYLPIEAISAEASREKSIRKGHYIDPASVVGQAAPGGLPGGSVWGISSGRINSSPRTWHGNGSGSPLGTAGDRLSAQKNNQTAGL